MRLHEDKFYETMNEDLLKQELLRLDELCNVTNMNTKQSIAYLKKLQRQRHLIFWHDASTISNHSHLLMTVSCLYDVAIHLTDSEYYEKYGE